MGFSACCLHDLKTTAWAKAHPTCCSLRLLFREIRRNRMTYRAIVLQTVEQLSYAGCEKGDCDLLTSKCPTQGGRIGKKPLQPRKTHEGTRQEAKAEEKKERKEARQNPQPEENAEGMRLRPKSSRTWGE